MTEVYKLMQIFQHEKYNFKASFLIIIQVIFACIINNVCKNV